MGGWEDVYDRKREEILVRRGTLAVGKMIKRTVTGQGSLSNQDRSSIILFSSFFCKKNMQFLSLRHIFLPRCTHNFSHLAFCTLSSKASSFCRSAKRHWQGFRSCIIVSENIMLNLRTVCDTPLFNSFSCHFTEAVGVAC